MTSSDEIRNAVYSEEVSAVFRQMPIAIAVNAVIAALAATVLAPLATRPLPLAWLAAVLLVTTGRLILWLQYRRASVRAESIHRWSQLATAGSLAAGLSWGLGGALILPVIPALGKIFLTIVVAGMCAGAVTVSASHLWTSLAFLLSATLPMALRFFADGTATDRALGGMTVVFAAALALASRQFCQTFAETMRLRFELNEANLRLRAEVAQHRVTEAELRQAQKLETIGQLTGGIAHDFNNLLTVIVGNIALVNERTDDASPIAPFVQRALKAAERGVAVIEHMLAFARKQDLNPQSVDLARLVFGMEELLWQTVGTGVHLLISADPGLSPARVDANQVELAILNLVINARDAMPEGGTVQITLENQRAGPGAVADLPPGDFVVVSISDDGTGMDDATLAHAFDPFFTTKEIGSGSGLGLLMVQNFASRSGGTVHIHSKVDQGTTVELYLPRAS